MGRAGRAPAVPVPPEHESDVAFVTYSPAMRLTFLGTSAANAFPEAFCHCDNCVRARAAGGHSLRKRSAALVNDDLLIDLGPDVMTACQQHGRTLMNVRHCLQTHPHSDHLDATHLLSRSREYGTLGTPLLNFYSSPQTAAWAAKMLARDFEPGSLLDVDTQARLNVAFHTIAPFRPVHVGAYWVTAFPANHDVAMGSLLYAVQAEGRAFFYGTDTAALSEEVWAGFRQFDLRFDVVILDHTYGPEQSGDGHLSARQVIAHLDRMRTEGILRPGGRAFATHIAHEGNPPHAELSAFAVEHGYEVAFDGLTIEV